ncbi:MAG TPA: SpoIIE family protein phosphatase [Acidobacteriaceae bacterium]|nr:SpoIIE family protein phosphatase [Acidobacteriaceae bacterium]
MKKTPSVLLLSLLAVLAAHAESTPAATPIAQITIGQATVALNGPWRFHIGDNPQWAGADFDDSSWGTMDLSPPPGSYDPITGNSGFVPGWTTRGFAGHTGYAWYRLRVNVQDKVEPGEDGTLALKMPENVDDIYQVFVNGRMVGQFGGFAPAGNTFYMTQPRAFPLPKDLANGPMTIAVRMWMSPATPLFDPDTGGMHGAPVLGRASVIQALLRLDWDVLDRANESDFLEIWILLTAMVVALTLFWMDRGEPAYLLLALTCAALAVYPFLIVAGYYTTWINSTAEVLLRDLIPGPLAMGLWVLFWGYWFRLDRVGHMARLHRTVWTLVGLLLVGTSMLRAPLYGSVVPIHAILWLSPVTLVLKLLLGALLLWVTYEGIRRDPTEGWLALPVVLLVAVSLYQSELLVLLMPVFFFPFGFAIDISQIAIVLSLGIITVLLLRRFLRSQREREQWKLDIKQAQEVQRVLIPETLPHVAGLTIESEYRPARDVGGDFFQILPHPTDGSVLIVVGDVTGHGLQAGMLVALIVGAIRNQVDSSFDPLNMMQSLNKRLCGRGQAHATGLALRIAADGSATLANAGHLPPYLNGKELPMEGALPLGMTEEAEFSVMHFQLAPEDRLLLLSDGIAEARNQKGQLFGFERIRELLKTEISGAETRNGATGQRPITAAEVAAAAQAFGQEDDISVLSLIRTTNLKAVPA